MINYDRLLTLLYNTYEKLPYSEYFDIFKITNNNELLKSGILCYRELEMIFYELIKSKMNFESNFDHEILKNKFGPAAINLSNNFIESFKNIYSQYK